MLLDFREALLMISNQVRALSLAFLLPFLAVPIPVPASQEPSETAPAEEAGENPQVQRPTRRPGLLPLSLIAEVDLGSRAVGPALFHEEALVVATARGEVLSLDAATLETRWKLGMPGAELFPPVLLPNGILIASRSGNLILLQPETGEILTERSVGPSLALSPIWDGRTLFLATPDREVMAYDVEERKESWRSKIQDPPLAMTSGAGLLLVSDRSGGLHALDALTGALRWQFQGRGNFEAQAAFDDAGERFYLGDTAGFLYSISVREGKVHYRWANGAAITHSALLEEDCLFVVSYANTLFSYRPGNGHELWRANLPGRPAAAPVRARRRLVVLTLNGQVAEYAAAGGQPGPQIYAAPDDILPYPTFVPRGMALPLRSGKLLLLVTSRPAPSESVEPDEDQDDLGEDPPQTEEEASPPQTLGRTPLS